MFDVVITQNYYEDNYEDGMISNTYTTYEFDTLHYDVPTASEAITKAIEYIKNTCAFVPKDAKAELISNDELVVAIPCIEVASDEYGFFATPSDAQMSDWQNGKINLFNLEYQFKVFEIKEVTLDDLSDDVKKLIA